MGYICPGRKPGSGIFSFKTLLSRLQNERMEPSAPFIDIVNLMYRTVESRVEEQEYILEPDSPDRLLFNGLNQSPPLARTALSFFDWYIGYQKARR